MKKKSFVHGIYAGTFDPLTNGHLDIISRAFPLFDKLTVLIAESPTKKPLFSIAQRKEMLELVLKDFSNVCVDFCEGLVVDYALKVKANVLVRGLRPTGDFENEFQMATMNNYLHKEIETLFFMTGHSHYFISSSLIKEVFKHGGDIKDLVPEVVLKQMKNMFQSRG